MSLHLVGWLIALGTAPADGLDAPGPASRIESITPDLDGKGGVMLVQPFALADSRARFAYGAKRCHGAKIDAAVVEQMFQAMRTRQGVTVVAAARESAPDLPCLGEITFFAP
ncbi:MAG: hypothetical protein IPH07_00540 [Deltaproteobacteria bacterium]|nr:hypothetical protein [Deltaproteobacteria bacterium]MBK8238513.1 hypothetical protein [Deltaproteobacteria bacterium]MBK8717341.1 hypothetical protein [Deltaproteobacteria bacterium]MBP7286206.1 hypothetical protein [Nannocystaceae bacterium]